VARKGVIVLHEAFGCLIPEPDSPPLKLDAIFPLTSISKPITATAAMMLVEDGLLGLNRPVQWYIPEFVGEGKEQVMVHHLLTHTSGLNGTEVSAHIEEKRDAVENPSINETRPPSIDESLLLGYDAPLWKPPGIEMSYCSFGYELVAEIIRRISVISLDEFTRERIFVPLGMSDTCFIVPDSMMHRSVRAPAGLPYTWPRIPGVQETPSAAGGAFSTAMDIAIFGQMFLNRGIYDNTRILSSASVAAMTRNQIPGIGAQFLGELFPEAEWGLGWNVCVSGKNIAWGEPLPSREAFSHGGSSGVFLWVDPVYELVGVYFSVALQDFPKRYCPIDLFINAVTAAVMD
jgi:CubicO group peptidase (beta-lactamase class C family)